MKESRHLTMPQGNEDDFKDESGRHHWTFLRRRDGSHVSTTLWLTLIVVLMSDSVNGSKICTERTLVGTKETGHHVLYDSREDSVVVNRSTVGTGSSKRSFLRNHDQTDTLSSSTLSIVLNGTLDLRIASYNIRAAFPSDRGSDCTHPFGWESRVDQVAEQINFYHPDVLGLQEDTFYQINQLKAFLTGYRYVGVNRDDCEQSPNETTSPVNPFGVTHYDGDCAASKESDALIRGGEFNSIWFRPDVVDLQSWGVFWLGSETAMPGSHFLNSTCAFENFSSSCDVGRIVTWACFRPKGLPYDFFVFNTHVTSNVEGKKKTPEALIRKIDDIAGSNLSYALGDFATAQFSKTYKMYQSYLNDPDNPHPSQPQAVRQWPAEANNEFRRGGRVVPPYGTFGPFVDSEGAVYDFIWGHHIKILSMLNDRLRNTTSEERRRLRSDHRMLLATVELSHDCFFQNGHAVDYPLHLVPRVEVTSSASHEKIALVIFIWTIVLSLWSTFG